MQTADILLVDDNRADVGLMTEALKDAAVDNTLHIISDSSTVMAFLSNDTRINPGKIRPDLIMLDINMPHKSGLEVLKEIKHHEQFKIIPVIVMTNSNAETDIAKAYEYQANSYITKPVNYEKLVALTEIIEKYWLVAAKLPPK